MIDRHHCTLRSAAFAAASDCAAWTSAATAAFDSACVVALAVFGAEGPKARPSAPEAHLVHELVLVHRVVDEGVGPEPRPVGAEHPGQQGADRPLHLARGRGPARAEPGVLRG